MRKRLLNLLSVALLATLPASCVLTQMVDASIRQHEAVKLELVAPGAALDGYYLGVETIDGDAKHVVAVRGLLRDVPSRELLLYLSANYGESLVREVAAGPHDDAPRVIIEYPDQYRPMRTDGDPSRPLWIRLTTAHADSIGIFGNVAGRQIGGVARLKLSYRKRSLLAAGLRRSLYLVTYPIDIVAFPFLFSIAIFSMEGKMM